MAEILMIRPKTLSIQSIIYEIVMTDPKSRTRELVDILNFKRIVINKNSFLIRGLEKRQN